MPPNTISIHVLNNNVCIQAIYYYRDFRVPGLVDLNPAAPHVVVV